MTVTVNNVAPTISSLTGNTNINEGETASFSAIATDPGDDTLIYAWDFGDESTAEGKDVTHTFADNGNYTVTLTVTDDDGASTSQTLEVTVNNIAPTITAIDIEEIIYEQETIQFSATATDPGDDILTYSWNFGDGSEELTVNSDQLPVEHIYADSGNYPVTLTVTDDDGALTTQTIDIFVKEDLPPEFTATVTPEILWSPNHKMVEIFPTITATDDRDPNPTIKLESITSSEVDDGNGDGNTSDDIEITADGRIFLRAERSGLGTDRVYTLTYSATDNKNNVTYQNVSVIVPHNVGTENKPPIFAKISTNLVQNWSFENNEVQPNRWGIFQNITGWTTTKGAGIEVQELNERFGSGEDGTAWVELDSHKNSSMRQNIPTKPEASYQLSFAYSPRPNVHVNSNRIEVYWNGQLLDTIKAQGSQKNNWQTYTYNLSASNLDLTALEFRAVGKSDSRGGFIDAVSVKEIIDLSTTLTIQISEQQSEVIDLMAFDPEGETEGNGLTYSIIGGADADLFSLDLETGLVRFIEAPDFVQPQDLDSDNIYELEVAVSDSEGLTDTVKLAIAIQSIDQPTEVQILGENKVQNWSFEDNEVEPNRWGVFKSIAGWFTTKGAGIEVQELNERFGSGDDGTAWVELDSHKNSRMRQNIPTKPETSYQLSFAYSPRPNVNVNSNRIEVYWNGQLIDTIKAQGSQKNNWQTYTYNLSASNLDLTALEFRAVGKSDSRGGFIDAVSVKEIIR